MCFRLLYFDVERNTGKIYVKNATLLDREVRSLYSATLEARDTDGKPGTTMLEITVTDINDQSPVINRDSYLDFVKEGGQLEVKIEVIMSKQWLFLYNTRDVTCCHNTCSELHITNVKCDDNTLYCLIETRSRLHNLI